MDSDTQLRIERPEFVRLFRKVKHRPHKPKLSPSHLAKIGRVVVKFQRLEFTLGRLLTAMLGIDSFRGSLLVSEMSFGRMVSLFASLSAQLRTNGNDTDVLIQALGDAEQLRNRILHSMWARGQNAGTVAMRIKLKGHRDRGLVQAFERLSVADLQRVALWIDKVDTALEARWISLGTPASAGIVRQKS